MKIDPQNKKRAGEANEIAFIHAAMIRGYRCAKPFGESDKYDVVLDADGRLFRVQVKSAINECAAKNLRKYCIGLKSANGKPYSPRDVDIVAMYIEPLNLWYIVPVIDVQTVVSASLRPLADNITRYAKYEEAWFYFNEPLPTSPNPT